MAGLDQQLARRAGINREKVTLVLNLKRLQRTQPEIDASWKEYCSTMGGIVDPTIYSVEVLKSFFELLEEKNSQAAPAPESEPGAWEDGSAPGSGAAAAPKADAKADEDAEFDKLIAETVQAEEQDQVQTHKSWKSESHAPAQGKKAEETRLANDGGRYTLAEFISFYGQERGTKLWDLAGQTAPQEASSGASNLEADWAKYLELMSDPDDSLVATGGEEVSQALAKGDVTTVFFADGLRDADIQSPKMKLSILERAGGHGYIVPRHSPIYSELTEYGGAAAVLRGAQEPLQKRRRVDDSPAAAVTSQMLLAISQPKAKAKAKAKTPIRLRSSLNSLLPPPPPSSRARTEAPAEDADGHFDDEAWAEASGSSPAPHPLMMLATTKAAPKVIPAKFGSARAKPFWRPPAPVATSEGAQRQLLMQQTAKAAPQFSSEYGQAAPSLPWPTRPSAKAAPQMSDSVEDIYATAMPKALPSAPKEVMNDSPVAMVSSAVPKALPPGPPPGLPQDAKPPPGLPQDATPGEEAQGGEAPMEMDTALEISVDEQEEQKKQRLLKEAANEVQRAKKIRELKSELKQLGTQESLQDKHAIPKFARQVCDKYLEQMGEKDTFQVFADVFHKVKFAGHRKALVFVAHDLLTNKRRFRSASHPSTDYPSMDREKVVKFVVSLTNDFLMGISDAISKMPPEEHAIYEKILDLWTSKEALTSSDLATLRSRWTRQ
mmetsp:Transcript_75902/g.134330  ORF Transcript_75902/g.134330 Transcript_75902/m.134330 type:complete len:719 (+) Transcript_75902:53-2209(+)